MPPARPGKAPLTGEQRERQQQPVEDAAQDPQLHRGAASCAGSAGGRRHRPGSVLRVPKWRLVGRSAAAAAAAPSASRPTRPAASLALGPRELSPSPGEERGAVSALPSASAAGPSRCLPSAQRSLARPPPSRLSLAAHVPGQTRPAGAAAAAAAHPPGPPPPLPRRFSPGGSTT